MLFPLVAPRPANPAHHLSSEHYDGYIFAESFQFSPHCEKCRVIADDIFGITGEDDVNS
jgi:hypothetical protein